MVKSSAVVCASCETKRKRLPQEWGRSSDLQVFCPACWESVRCTTCKSHDSRGAHFKGNWTCRACSHSKRVRFSEENMQEECHQLIMGDIADQFPVSLQAASSEVQVVESGSDMTEGALSADDECDDECDDELAPLPTASSGSWVHVKPDGQDASHVVLLIDMSGSMRTEDVVGPEDGRESQPQLISRLLATLDCAAQFVQAHACKHQRDVFSAVVFSDKATVVGRLLDSEGTQKALQTIPLRGAGGTFYKSALEAAYKLLGLRPALPGHILLLSDGRPADTKSSLAFFQQGVGQKTPIHGIGFGTSVQNFTALQQLSCLSGGTFVLSGCSVRDLSSAFSSVSSTITSSGSMASARGQASLRRELRTVQFEAPDMGVFGKNGVMTFNAARATLRYDGSTFVKQSWPPSSVSRRVHPNMRGAMRLVYAFRDKQVVKDEGSWMVAKASRYEDEVLNSVAVVESHVKSTAVAMHFAGRFNEHVHRKGASAPCVCFVPCFTYHVEDPHFCKREPTIFAAERYLPGVFLKYNSNNGYVNEGFARHHEAVQAFTHFTFVESGGQLMVADLQGVARDAEVLLTDPQVLSTAGGFGPGDLQSAGIRACLAAHRCGPTCRKLGLKPFSTAVLRRLGTATGNSRQLSSSSAGWERLSVRGGSDFDKVSEYNLTDLAGSEVGGKSSQASASSWAILDM